MTRRAFLAGLAASGLAGCKSPWWFGAAGKPIYSKSFESKPGRDKTKCRNWN